MTHATQPLNIGCKRIKLCMGIYECDYNTIREVIERAESGL
ncbi:uncharacterized protein RAG0_11902 [Rhynchosporium agropyri]|uniref:Uncharacterized protein n=1 Tax=Rhynchosporium agropyri TaxID=914238 RepID=A0A1E1L6I6_9HELO|nr:uncharacterized protein RAG0_11902 [Rhynchosporium agropyri]